MRDLFPEFYRYDDKKIEEIFKDCMFVFDTNVLLNLYRYTDTTRKDILNILDKIKNQLWMPYQVGLELHFNRTNVILDQSKAYGNIRSEIDGRANEFIKELRENLHRKFDKRHPKIDMKNITDRLQSCIDGLLEELQEGEQKHPDLIENDVIMNRLNTLYEGKVGGEYNQEKLDVIYQQGVERYKRKCPPGYEDGKVKKGQLKQYNGIIYKDEYGDLVVWMQMIKKSKESKKPIIFITDDSKEDWWKREKGGILGPRIELLNEFNRETEQSFYMYRTEQFMNFIKKYLKQRVNKESIKEVEDLRKSDMSFEALISIPNNDEKKTINFADLFEKENDDEEKLLWRRIKVLERKIEDILEKIYKTIPEEKGENYQGIALKYYALSIHNHIDQNTLGENISYETQITDIYLDLQGIYKRALGSLAVDIK
ncbi:PIN-like domain-containing protein [Bacillus thuringiensis]|uniref:PIN-like domain-containing protein n=1 Tax=Bacillus thuringiensis TaxID=1428 RepID=UPI0020C31AAE|nr:PIN-like domain-containing protein [Bacillus thuringiensis]HDR7450324.1 DUF4935 domain-containing protein [Bacillus cereus]